MADTLESLIFAICEYYEKDPTAPSVIISYLRDKQSWYASVVRYHGRFADGKEVVISAQYRELEGALETLSQKWLISIGKGPAVNRLDKKIDALVHPRSSFWSALVDFFQTPSDVRNI